VLYYILVEHSLNLENFNGPLDKLLELIETKKLEITKVSLASVTADFLEYLEELKKESSEEEYPSTLADFLLVASRLLLIKSKALLPSLELTEEEEMDIKDLEERLKLYQELKKTQEHIKQKWSPAPSMFAREFLTSHDVIFYPPSDISSNMMHESLHSLIEQFKKVIRPQETIKTEMINLKEKIEEIVKRITNTPISFKKLSSSGNKGELVVIFLAVLHLVHQRIIDVTQNGHFEEITVAKHKSI